LHLDFQEDEELREEDDARDLCDLEDDTDME